MDCCHWESNGGKRFKCKPLGMSIEELNYKKDYNAVAAIIRILKFRALHIFCLFSCS
jgi:hypothetical protein